MLHHYVHEHHEKWVSHLPYAEFAINNSTSASTGHTPFYLNYGEHPATPLSNVIPNIEDVPVTKPLHSFPYFAELQRSDSQSRQLLSVDHHRSSFCFLL